MQAAGLNGKQLLTLWNGLPGAETLKKVGDRAALIGRLWEAMQALPCEPAPPELARSKQTQVIALLQRPEGATVAEIVAATGWQRHTVRGLFSGTLKKKLGLTLRNGKEERGRVYRIAESEVGSPPAPPAEGDKATANVEAEAAVAAG